MGTWNLHAGRHGSTVLDAELASTVFDAEFASSELGVEDRRSELAEVRGATGTAGTRQYTRDTEKRLIAAVPAAVAKTGGDRVAQARRLC